MSRQEGTCGLIPETEGQRNATAEKFILHYSVQNVLEIYESHVSMGHMV